MAHEPQARIRLVPSLDPQSGGSRQRPSMRPWSLAPPNPPGPEQPRRIELLRIRRNEKFQSNLRESSETKSSGRRLCARRCFANFWPFFRRVKQRSKLELDHTSGDGPAIPKRTKTKRKVPSFWKSPETKSFNFSFRSVSNSSGQELLKIGRNEKSNFWNSAETKSPVRKPSFRQNRFQPGGAR